MTLHFSRPFNDLVEGPRNFYRQFWSVDRLDFEIGLKPKSLLAQSSYTCSNMGNNDAFVAEVLELMGGNVIRLRDVFETKLSHREELMLSRMDVEIGNCIEGILDLVLSSSAINEEMTMDVGQRKRVMELTSIRREIHAMIDERGSLQDWKEGLN